MKSEQPHLVLSNLGSAYCNTTLQVVIQRLVIQRFLIHQFVNRDSETRGTLVLFAMLAAGTLQLSTALGQGHTDVQFSYSSGRISLQPPSGSSDLVFATEFPTSGIEQQFATLPGFASEVDVGLGIGPGDEIVYNVLDNLLYWADGSFAEPPDGVQIRVRNNPPSVPDSFITADSGRQPGSTLPPINRIGASGGAGDFHVDLQWFLDPNNFPTAPPPPAFGAYGVKLSLSTSAAAADDSEPFFLVFNFGLSSATLAEAVDAFTAILTPILEGDYNGNNYVDAADYVVWRDSLGKMGDDLPADGNGNMEVSQADYEFWKQRFRNTGAAAAVSSIPEPPTGMVIMAAALGLALIDRDWRRHSFDTYSNFTY